MVTVFHSKKNQFVLVFAYCECDMLNKKKMENLKLIECWYNITSCGQLIKKFRVDTINSGFIVRNEY